MADQVLIRRCQAGDDEAFRLLFEQYKNLVYRTTYLTLGTAGDADDILQAGIAAEARPSEKTTRFLRKGDRSMKLRWRIALGTAAAVVLAAAVIAAVPSSRAAAGGFFADVFNIKTGPAATLNYLPSGFTSQASAAVGSLSVGPENKADAMEEALYRDGDEFVAVTTRSDDGAALPNGQDATVNGVKAVLQTGLSGSFDLAVLGPDGAKDGGTPPAGASPQGGAPSGGDGPVTIQGAGSVTVVSGDTVITGEVPAGQSEIGISVNSNGEGQSVVNVAGDPVDLPVVSYEGANSLTWIVDGTRIVLLSNLPVEELQKIADGLVLND